LGGIKKKELIERGGFHNGSVVRIHREEQEKTLGKTKPQKEREKQKKTMVGKRFAKKGGNSPSWGDVQRGDFPKNGRELGSSEEKRPLRPSKGVRLG